MRNLKLLIVGALLVLVAIIIFPKGTELVPFIELYQGQESGNLIIDARLFDEFAGLPVLERNPGYGIFEKFSYHVISISELQDPTFTFQSARIVEGLRESNAPRTVDFQWQDTGIYGARPTLGAARIDTLAWDGNLRDFVIDINGFSGAYFSFISAYMLEGEVLDIYLSDVVASEYNVEIYINGEENHGCFDGCYVGEEFEMIVYLSS